MIEILYRDLGTMATGNNEEEKNKNGKMICNKNSYCSQMLAKDVKLVRLNDLGFKEDAFTINDLNFEYETIKRYKNVMFNDLTGITLYNRDKNNHGATVAAELNFEETFNMDKHKNLPYDVNLFWVLKEPPEGFGESYTYLELYPDMCKGYKAIFTYDQKLLNCNYDNVYFYPWGTSLLDSEEQFKIYNKNKLVSYFYSNKTWWEGHEFRHKIADRIKKGSIKNNITVGGPFKYKDYLDKIDTVKDYYFSIQVENVFIENFFSDKVVDCCLTGTVPIYKGCTNIEKYFNTDGFILFNDENELLNILKNLTVTDYHKKEKAIKENFELAKKYIHPEDYIYNNYKHLFV